MARRCEHCKHWHDTVFLGESQSGWGCWEGWCQFRKSGYRIRHHSLMLACEHFDRAEEPKPCEDCQRLHELITEGKASILPSKCYPANGEPCQYIKVRA